MPADIGTATHHRYNIGAQSFVHIDWTSDAAGDVLLRLGELTGELVRMETKPLDGPADNYAVKLVNELGNDTLLGKGANRDTADTEEIQVYDDNDPEVRRRLSGLHALEISGAGDTKSGVALIVLKGVTPLVDVYGPPRGVLPPGGVPLPPGGGIPGYPGGDIPGETLPPPGVDD